MYCQVTLLVPSPKGDKTIWFVFKTPHENLKNLNHGLTMSGTVWGVRLETEPAGDGRRVVDRYEIIVSRDAVHTISEMQSDLYDEQGQIEFSPYSATAGA